MTATTSLSSNPRKRKNTGTGTSESQATLHNFFGANPPKRRVSNPKQDNRDDPIIILDSDEEVELVCDGPKVLESPPNRAAERCCSTNKPSTRSSPGKENLIPFTRIAEETTTSDLERDSRRVSYDVNVPLSPDSRCQLGEPSSVTLDSFREPDIKFSGSIGTATLLANKTPSVNDTTPPSFKEECDDNDLILLDDVPDFEDYSFAEASETVDIDDIETNWADGYEEIKLESDANASLATSSSDAFSVLMTSHSTKQVWTEADAHEDRRFKPTKANGGRRKAPFYKVLQGMPISVDAFRYGNIPGVTAHFLTHAHSDHYTNLSSNWENGYIYCSETTAKLIIHKLSVAPRWVRSIPMDQPTVIPNTGGVTVTLIDANHCPGSTLFLFEGKQTVNAGDSAYKSPHVGSSRIFRYLHCGDFRACPKHVLHPAIKGRRIDHVYLDTTYLNPKYCFPPQQLVISACADLAVRLVHGTDTRSGNTSQGKSSQNFLSGWMSSCKKENESVTEISDSKTLILVGTYSIGKERIVKAIAKSLNSKIYADSRKTAIIKCQTDPELHALLTNNPRDARVHIVPLNMISSDQIKSYLDKLKDKFDKVVGFRPTGWTYTPPTGTDQSPPISKIIARDQSRPFSHEHLKPMRNSTPKFMLYGVPYSEHSSFFELTCFALSLDWSKIIATVNVGSERSRGNIDRWIDKWGNEKKRRLIEGIDSSSGGIVHYRGVDYW